MISVDLTSWQRHALKLLGDHDGRYAPAKAQSRIGCKGLVKDGLARQVEGEFCVYELTDAGHGEYARRKARARA